jgi:hypothetical protein
MVLNYYDLLESNSAYKWNNDVISTLTVSFRMQWIVIFVGVRKLIAVAQ